MPALIQDLADEKAAAAFGAKLATALKPGAVICLDGPLGAGKTTVSRGIIQAYAGAREVPSPTFTLVETYDGPHGALWHFDLYRLEKPQDLWELGLEEALEEGIVLVEWPDRAVSILPKDALSISFEILENDARRVTLKAPETWREPLQAAGIA